MKNKQEIISIREDQTYLQGINLVTGLKINYDRVAITPSQLDAMCINQNLTKPQKALKILKKGQNMQRWSILQNLALYLQNSSSYQDVFQTIWKYFQDLGNMMGVLAQGIQNCLDNLIMQYQKTKNNNGKSKLSKKSEEIIYKIVYRGLTDQKYNTSAFQDVSNLFSKFFSYLEIYNPKSKIEFIEECRVYINSSFAMNALPEKRKIAFQMMKCLMEHSEKIYTQAKSKALFFNNDLNPLTRRTICQLMTKILANNQVQSQQIRKCIIQYFFDKIPVVREVAFQCLISIGHQKHVQVIFNCLKQQNQQIEFQFLGNIQKISLNLSKDIIKNQKHQQVLINFLKKAITSKNTDMQTLIIQNAEYLLQLVSMHNKNYQDILCLESLNFQNQQLYKSLIKLFNQTQIKELKIYLHPFVQKSIKINRQIFFSDHYFLEFYLKYLKNGSEESNYVHVNYLTKSLQENKWRHTQIILKSLVNLQLSEVNYQKISITLYKLITSCPYNLIELTCKVIVRLMVTKRKNMDLFTSVKQRLINSKCWIYRRNYIVLYAQIKQGASFQYQRLIPILNYKLIIKDRIEGIKFQFIKYALKIYTHIDPTSYVQKNAIRQTLAALKLDESIQINEKAAQTLAKIEQIDIDLQITQINLNRNNLLVEREQKMKQKQAILKKSVKSERDVGVNKKQIKVKSKITQNRTSLIIGMDLSRPGTGTYKRTNLNQTANLNSTKQQNKLLRTGSGLVNIEAKKYLAFKKQAAKK